MGSKPKSKEGKLAFKLNWRRLAKSELISAKVQNERK